MNKISRYYTLSVLLLALIYFTAAKFGLSLATIHPSATAVWAPTGIAIATFLLFGRKLWPGVFLGAFFANFTTEGTVLTSLGIAFGNTMEGLFAALLVNKYAGGKDFLREPQTIFRFAVVAGVFSTLISATVGPGILLWKGFIEPELFLQVMATWWLGDAVGALVVTPFLIAWVTPFADKLKREDKNFPEESEPGEPWRRRKVLEAFLMIAAIIIVTRIIFGGVFTIGREGFSLSFIAMSLLIWPALRFNTKITTLAAFLLAATAAYGMLNPFQMSFLGSGAETSFLVLQVFSGFSAVGALLVASLVENKKSTEEKLLQSYETLAVEEQYFRMLAETVPQIVWSADRFGNYNYINKLWFEYTGRNPRDPRNSQWTEEEWEAVIHPADYAEEKKRWEASLATGEGHEMGYRLRRADGVYRWHFARIVPVKDRTGKVVYWVGTMVDIDKHKKAEEHQRLIVEKIKDEDARKNTFLAVLSHELRNPLAAITLSLDLLEIDGSRKNKESKTRDPEFDWLMHTAREQFARVTRIVDDLLQVSRIMHGKFELRQEEAALQEILQSAITTAMPMIAERGHTFSLSLPPEPAPRDMVLLADTMRLEQALVNLLQNAAKYTPNGGRISLHAKREDSTALIVLTDNGIGIDGSMVERIFEPFTQGSQTIAREAGGLGVGLMLAKTIIEAHGGTIRAESDGKNKGSRFIIRLPLA